MNYYRKTYFLTFFLMLFVTACNLNAKEKNPYVAYGEMVISDSSEYEIAGLSLYVMNRAEKAIESFTLVFYVFDENGNVPFGMRNNIVLEVSCEVDAMKSLETVLNMDKYMTTVPDEPYQIDYLYLSKISYEDGTSWSDPLGFKSF